MLLTKRIAEKLKLHSEKKLTRLRQIRGCAQTAIQDGFLVFNSNDYLGLANHPQVVKALTEGANLYGVGSGSAHTINGHTRAHHELEETIAQWTQRPRALTFSTGYMANIGIMQALSSPGDIILQDKLNHASLLDSANFNRVRSYRFRHKQLQDCERLLNKFPENHKWILTDSIFSMDGDCAPLLELAELAKKYQASLVVDDAHGIGVFGPNGSGTLNSLNLSTLNVPVLMGTLGKAIGCMGAFVAADDEIIEACLQFARTYLFTTAMPPTIAMAATQAIHIIQNESWRQETLFDLIRYFKLKAKQADLKIMPSNSPIQPLLIGNCETALNYVSTLKNQGILLSAIRPPTVPIGQARLRITLSVNHTKQHIDQLISACLKTEDLLGVKHANC